MLRNLLFRSKDPQLVSFKVVFVFGRGTRARAQMKIYLCLYHVYLSKRRRLCMQSITPFSRTVVAGVASLGGEVTVAVRNSLLLECKSVGSPPPRTVWYHNQNIITHHPRFTRNRDDSLLIKSKYLS